jgi:hypothetical protein
MRVIYNQGWFFAAVVVMSATLGACANSANATAPLPPAGPFVGSNAVVAGVISGTGGAFPTTSGTYQYLTTRWGGLSGPGAPFPMPTTTSTTYETVSTNATLGSQQGLIAVETSTKYSDYLETERTYSKWTGSPGAQSLGVVATTWSDTGKITGSGLTLYSLPLEEVRFPFVAGGQWNGAYAYHETSSAKVPFDGKTFDSTMDETLNADGSYEAHALNPVVYTPHNWRWKTSVASDGSWNIITGFIDDPGATPYPIYAGVPRNDGSGKYVLPFTGAPGLSNTIADWYPGHALPPSPMYASTVKDLGARKLPAVCAVPASLATSGEEIETTTSSFDPSGTIINETYIAYYTDGVGMVCQTYNTHGTYYHINPQSLTLVHDGHSTGAGIISLQSITSKSGARAASAGNALSAYSIGPAMAISFRRQAADLIRQRALRP